jgi:mannose-1-phosphate guanylyltransferase
MRGMLLAAGLGTRLSPLTDERPKPVVPVGLEPLAADAMRTFAKARVTRIDVNAYHLPDVLEAELLPHAPPGVPLLVHRETSLLGTGGGIRAAVSGAGASDELVLVMNGDIRFAPDVDALAAAHVASGALVTLVVREHPDPFAFGAVERGADGFVVRIAGKPSSSIASTGAYVFTGVHLLSPAALAWMPAEGCVVRQAYQPMLAAGLRIAAVIDRGPWADLGTIPVYYQANMALADASEDPRGVVHPAARIDPDATIDRCVIGAGAIIGPRARLSRSVVWSGAVADAEISGTVITPRASVRADGPA